MNLIINQTIKKTGNNEIIAIIKKPITLTKPLKPSLKEFDILPKKVKLSLSANEPDSWIDRTTVE